MRDSVERMALHPWCEGHVVRTVQRNRGASTVQRNLPVSTHRARVRPLRFSGKTVTLQDKCRMRRENMVQHGEKVSL